MKPTLPHLDSSNRRSARALSGAGFTSLQTDYHFQPRSADFSGRCRGNSRPSFRRISEDYFSREAHSHSVVETAVFALIVLTAGVSVVEGMRGLAQFVYG